MAIPSTAQRVKGAPAPRRLPVAVDWGLGYEVLIALEMFIGSEDAHSYEVGPAWFKTVHQRASRGLTDLASKVFGKRGYGVVALAGLARDTGGRSVAALASRVRQDKRGDFKWAMLHGEPSLRAGIQSGEPEALKRYLKHFHSKSERDAAMRFIEADPHQLAVQVADLIERFDREIFSEIGPPLEGDLKASAQSVSRLARQLPWDRLIIKATQGVEYRAEPWIDSVVLVPSILNRPWVDISEYEGTKFFFYPVSREAATPDAQLVEVYKALGDETRLRILRLLSGGESNLTEIAQKLGLAKSTVHGHMRILRVSGLTRSVVGDEGKGYVLNDRPDLNSLLDSYLKA